MPADGVRATGVGDFDDDGVLNLLTIAAPSFSESADGPQPATVLYGPISRDGGGPRHLDPRRGQQGPGLGDIHDRRQLIGSAMSSG
ncbi:hypothetical protein [Streptomyces sp. 8N706]|uniref:hypothetical protein n=1 Tax=Streptomyces sp. 8N706 TaxID=3457416 RepID=UPI003FD09DEA